MFLNLNLVKSKERSLACQDLVEKVVTKKLQIQKTQCRWKIFWVLAFVRKKQTIFLSVLFAKTWAGPKLPKIKNKWTKFTNFVENIYFNCHKTRTIFIIEKSKEIKS